VALEIQRRPALPFDWEWWEDKSLYDVQPIDIAPYFAITVDEAQCVLDQLKEVENWRDMPHKRHLLRGNGWEQMAAIRRLVTIAKHARPIDRRGQTMVVSWR
jgi:hypothetical protein